MAVVSAGGVIAADLTGVTTVNVTSDTAAAAKNKAFDDARQQIIIDALSSYALPDLLQDAVKNASKGELTNLIASSSIDGEKISDTTYSANITMTVDADAARAWLVDKGVQSWLPDDASGDVFVAIVSLRNPVADWGAINRIARDEEIILDTKLIADGQVTMQVPSSQRAKFTIALRESGWRTNDRDGVLFISK